MDRPAARCSPSSAPSTTRQAADVLSAGDPRSSFVGPLLPPETRGTVRVLGVGRRRGRRGRGGQRGRADRRDARRGSGCAACPRRAGRNRSSRSFSETRTNGQGTYPAGRFVPLVPERDGRYRLDFNRARNPFCAYSSAYPCPAPWRGNTITAPVEAGERYAGSGLSVAEPGPEAAARLRSHGASWRLARDAGGIARAGRGARCWISPAARCRSGSSSPRRAERWSGRLCNGSRVPAALGRAASRGDSVRARDRRLRRDDQARLHGRLAGRRAIATSATAGRGSFPFRATRGRWPVDACARLARRAGGTRRSSRILARARASSSCGTGRRDSRGR